MSAPVPEKALQSRVVELARWHRWLVYHTYDSRRSSHGFPDLVMVRPPELLFVELKSSRGRVSHEQEKWLADLRLCGVEAHLWRPDDWPTIVQRLSRK